MFPVNSLLLRLGTGYYIFPDSQALVYVGFTLRGKSVAQPREMRIVKKNTEIEFGSKDERKKFD
jgi:hypothetical protein